jgi:hypothetical protein
MLLLQVGHFRVDLVTNLCPMAASSSIVRRRLRGFLPVFCS